MRKNGVNFFISWDLEQAKDESENEIDEKHSRTKKQP